MNIWARQLLLSHMAVLDRITLYLETIDDEWNLDDFELQLSLSSTGGVR